MQAITPLHVGSGKGVGFIDMPIMREKVTNWPLVPGSALKGVMRDYFSNLLKEGKIKQDLLDTAFGRASGDDNTYDDTSNAGSLILTDAHIVCLPVRSLYGTFAYTTCPLVLERLKRDLAAAGYKKFPIVPKPEEKEAIHQRSSRLISGANKIFFEDLDFDAKEDNEKETWADLLGNILFQNDPVWNGLFVERFAVISDDSFNFLTETCTEVSAHIRIDDEKKIVAKGALWYEEALPTEAIMSGIAWCDRVFGKIKAENKTENKTENKKIEKKDILDTFCPSTGLDLQVGGKATVGKGRVRCQFTKGGA
jgi:CRISPR-associated protein Cmr4